MNLLFKSGNSFNSIYVDFKDLTFSLTHIFAKIAQTIFVLISLKLIVIIV